MKPHTPKRDRGGRDRRGPGLADSDETVRVRCLVQAHEVRERPTGEYYIVQRPGQVELVSEVHTLATWGRETMSRRRWPQSDHRAYDYGRGRWKRCPTLDEQEGNAGEGFGDDLTPDTDTR